MTLVSELKATQLFEVLDILFRSSSNMYYSGVLQFQILSVTNKQCDDKNDKMMIRIDNIFIMTAEVQYIFVKP